MRRFRDTINYLWVFGPIYWITRDFVNPNTKRISVGFMRETNEPWRVGKGIQIHGFGYTFQIGVCKKTHYENSLDGELSVVGGRFLETPPEEIGNW